MSHLCGSALPAKEKILNVFNKQLKTEKICCSVNRCAADTKCSNRCSKTDGQHKMKRLKSRKERNQMRGCGKETSKSKSQRQHCCHQNNKDMAHFYNCCHGSCHCPSLRDAQSTNVIAATQEPSIITDSRLIGHHGLFNHEVKSVDIERLLSDQRKQGKSGQQAQEKNNAAIRPSSTPRILSSFSTNTLMAADTDEVVPFDKKTDLATKADVCQEKEMGVSQGSNFTPGQRSQQQPSLSSESTFSSKHRSSDVLMVKRKKTNPVMLRKGLESQVPPSMDRENVKKSNKMMEEGKGCMISSVEHTPKNHESPVQQTQACDLSPSPHQLYSSHTADSLDTRHRGQDPDHVSKSVSALAACLCDCLQFPLQRRRHMVAESRQVLLRALQERHGVHLQENLLQVQRCLGFGTDPVKGPAMIDEDELLPAEGFTAVCSQCFDTKKTRTFKVTGSQHFSCNSSPQLHQNLKQTAEWSSSPMETSVGLLDDILRPAHSPQLYLDFKPSGVSPSGHLFAPSPTSCWGENASASHQWEDGFIRPRRKEPVMFGSFENSLMNHTRALRERSSGPQYSNLQPFSPYQARLPDRPVLCSQEQDPSESDGFSHANPLYAQIHTPHQSSHLHPFSHLSACPPLRSHHTNMMHYPPSFLLERDPAHSASSFPSPEHWSFPPMRLY